MSTTRRQFLTTSAALAAGAAILPPRSSFAQAPPTPPTPPASTDITEIPELKTPESTREGDMLFRKFGRTAEKVSIIGMGGHHLGRLPSSADATKLLRRAVDSGINFMDNSWDYQNGKCETWMGSALQDGYRKKVFLMTKIDGQTAATAEKQLNESLKRLQTDVIDLIQLHEIVRWNDPDKHFAKNGSIEFLISARKAGKVRYIGFTGHKDPAMHNKMLDVGKKNDFQFDSSQFPLSVLDAHYKSFAHDFVPRCVKEGVAVLAMKTLCFGRIVETNLLPPIDCLHYAMNLPSTTVITGMDEESRLDQALTAVKTFKPFTKEELAALLTKTRNVALTGSLEVFKSTTMFDGTSRRPDWLGT